ncbi:MAG: hypothetical protein WED33_06030 [Bacteroidia bacterium]
MMRKFLSIMAFTLIMSTMANATESVVRVAQTFSQQKAYAGGYFFVKINIERRNLDSFFLIEQDLPKGCEAIGVESQGAIFSFKDGKVKYSWLRLPAEEEIQVMYKVILPFELRGKQEVEGKYYYIQDEEKKIFDLPSSSIEVIEYVAPSDSLAEKTLLGIINLDETKPDYVDEQKVDLEYKVQILSSTQKLDKDSIRKEYGMKDKLQEENFNGLYKYTVGSFNTYEQARDYKNKLDYSRYIPFVIAYNRGSRITVGEAMNLAAKKRTVTK